MENLTTEKYCTVKENWLDQMVPTVTTVNTDGSEVLTSGYVAIPNSTAVPIYNHWWYEPWYPIAFSTSPEIELKMSEVEVLREAAQKDKKLKKALQKFTPYIKVVVDF